MGAISGLSMSGLASAGVSAATVPLPSPALGKGAKAAREFEAQLIGTVLESLEKSFATIPGQDSVAGSDDYNYLGTQALASALAAGGGFGIARLISEHLGGTKVAPDGTMPARSNFVSGG
jgi:Rod binding domain-containing protein